MKKDKTAYVAYLSSYPPRECGIATFTADLTGALDAKYNPAVKSTVIALNESPSAIYNYDQKVRDEISSTELSHYVSLAKKINSDRDIKIVNIQHEFGLFGGDWGNYFVPFLQALEKPAVVSLHSVLPNPDKELKTVVSHIADKSSAVVVMNKFSGEILERDYGVPNQKIRLIAHGIPQTTFDPPEKTKAETKLENRAVISTFGLLGPDKGIEYVLRSLPPIIKKFPNLTYLILGETHPAVRKENGESYRNFLVKEVEHLNLKNHVKFYNKFLSLNEIVQYLKSSDIYIYPSLSVHQSVSGTISYALGCGRPVVGTETAYSKFLVNESNGILVKPKKPSEFSKAVISLLSQPEKMKSMSAAAYESSRHMIWPNVAAEYFKLYREISDLEAENKLPSIKLDHLFRLADSFGVMHHAKYSAPEPKYGYSLDDNSRALIVTSLHHEKNPNQKTIDLINTCLNFISFCQRKNGAFSNIVSLKKIPDKTADEDVQGRAFWSLCHTASSKSLPDAIVKKAERVLKKSLPVITRLESLRAISFAVSGLHCLRLKLPNKKNAALVKKFADALVSHYAKKSSPEWQWFEEHLTYSNSKLPEALFLAYDITKNKNYLNTAENTLNFLSEITFEKDHYAPIGQNGWYFRNKTRAHFDQQPEDASSMTQTKILAYKITKKQKHLSDAFKSFRWFLGGNHLSQMVYNETTGGCHDGLGEHGLNLNQGAESTISYLMARLAFEDSAVKNKFVSS